MHKRNKLDPQFLAYLEWRHLFGDEAVSLLFPRVTERQAAELGLVRNGDGLLEPMEEGK